MARSWMSVLFTSLKTKRIDNVREGFHGIYRAPLDLPLISDVFNPHSNSEMEAAPFSQRLYGVI